MKQYRVKNQLNVLLCSKSFANVKREIVGWIKSSMQLVHGVRRKTAFA